LIQEIKEISRSPRTYETKRKESIAAYLMKSYCETNLSEYDKALNWCKMSGQELVVTQFGKGIWAGLPWFHQNWGRDTFIALPGISIVTGNFTEAEEIIVNFTNYQQKDTVNSLFGRIPNRVISPENIIYNTADGTPWLIREIAELINYTGDLELAQKLFPVVENAIEGTIKNLIDADGFLTHDDADTWMDARIEGKEAWSPRGNRAVEIQVLWFTQLSVSAHMADLLGYKNQAAKWNELAQKVKKNFNAKFINPKNNTLFDHLDTNDNPDLQIRPNQMFALTVPLLENIIEPEIQSAVVQQVVSELTYTYGVASLSQNDKYFHPYHRNQIYHFDAAYHNGMCWQWISGPVVTGMVRMGYKDLAFEHSLNLTEQTLYLGMPGSLSELVQPFPKSDGSLHLTGTYSQAWSVSEFVRNHYQDYLGIRADMLNRQIIVSPQMPSKLTLAKFVINIGKDEQLEAIFEQNNDVKKFSFRGKYLEKPLSINLKLTGKELKYYSVSTSIENDQIVIFQLHNADKMIVEINGKKVIMKETDETIPQANANLSFQKPLLNPDLKTLKIPDYLQNIRKTREVK
jgi:glycogen debranching enzyme